MNRVQGFAWLCVAALAVLVGSSGACWAQQPSGAAARSEGLIMSGTIASVNVEQRIMRLKTGVFSTEQFAIDADAKITDGERSLQLDHLTPGAKVTVRYTDKEGRRIAEAIIVNASNAPPQQPAVQPSPSSADRPDERR
ncbi:MAG: hypothetical protein HY737_03575 [Candidatus Omnitrophica bacterium]|nr:hypothetical protein [Candidatus Omnitrophota bacterium]